jgi:hypothetical protein
MTPNRRTSSTSLVQSSMTCCGGSCGRGENATAQASGMLEPTQTSPLAVIIASIVPFRTRELKGWLAGLGQFTFVDRDVESAVIER